jgi:hypothetical protein
MIGNSKEIRCKNVTNIDHLYIFSNGGTESENKLKSPFEV